jgi:hypothetical protein
LLQSLQALARLLLRFFWQYQVFQPRASDRLLRYRVAFDWKFTGSTLPPHASLQSFPSLGHIPAKGKQVITLKASPGIPELVHAVASFEVAHFDPVHVAMSVEGVYASVATSLPRILQETWTQAVSRAAQSIVHRGGRFAEAVLKREQRTARDVKPGMQTGTPSPLQYDACASLLEPIQVSACVKLLFYVQTLLCHG